MKEFGRTIQNWQLHLRQHTFSLKFWSAKYLVCKIHIYKKIQDGKHHFFKSSDIPRHAHIGLNLPPWYAWLTPSGSLTICTHAKFHDHNTSIYKDFEGGWPPGPKEPFRTLVNIQGFHNFAQTIWVLHLNLKTHAF